MKKASYQGPSIETIEDLAEVLGISVALIEHATQQADRYYRQNKPKIKSDGGMRYVYTVLPPLFHIHDRILSNILHRVEFPDYIFAVRSTSIQKKDHIASAQQHAGAAIIIKDDIKDFFPSVKSPMVHKIWTDFFGFSSDVACRLTKLTTFSDCLPQGSKTSSYIASLVFWKKESELVHELGQNGFVYTRYVDDITISSEKRVEISEITTIKARLYGMFHSVGVKQNTKKSKRAISTRGYQQRIHGLNVNSGRPSLPKSERKRIRAAVHSLVCTSHEDRNSQEYKEKYAHVLGQAQYYRQLHPEQGQKLVLELKEIELN